MKTRSLLPLSCFVSASLLAQVQPDTVPIGTKADGTELRAVAYPLPQRAETFSMSKEGDYLCINFRETTKSGKYLQNKGEIGFYDLKRDGDIPRKPLSLRKGEAIGNKLLMLTHENRLLFLNMNEAVR